MRIIKQEIQFEESLKQRLEFICEFLPKYLEFLQELWYKHIEWCSRNFRSLESLSDSRYFLYCILLKI